MIKDGDSKTSASELKSDAESESNSDISKDVELTQSDLADPTEVLEFQSSQSTHPLVGKVIGERLEILSAIGSGGMSTVYKAKHLLLNRIVAVKVMRTDNASETGAIRFQQEAKAATKLNHPNVVAVREFGLTESGDPYLVMDYIDGKSLADELHEHGALLAERTQNIMAQVCAGLHQAHSLGVVHRDLKPANIMLSTDETGAETARIVDFGIAKVLQKDEQLEVTRAGEIFGTPLYMSPEQGLGKTVDRRSDIYSLGCIMYECLSGKPPFVCSTALETLMQHTSEPPAPLKVGGDLAQIVLCCLEKQPENRYQSAEQLRQSLLDTSQSSKIPRLKNDAAIRARRQLLFGIVCLIGGFALVISSVAWPHLRPLLFASNTENLAKAAKSNELTGNIELARSLYRKALAEADRENIPDASRESLYQSIGQFESKNQNYKSAINYLSRALTINEKHEEDFTTGSLNDWLSEAYQRSGNSDEAVKHGEAAVRIKEKIVPNHEFTLYALLHLGQAYRIAKDLPKAELIDRKALSLAQRLYPTADNVNLADAQFQLAHLLADRNKTSEAIEHYQEALKVSLIAQGPDSAVTNKFRDSLIQQLRLAGRVDEADKVPPLR